MAEAVVSQNQKKAETSTANFMALAILVTLVVVVVAGILIKGRIGAYALNSRVSSKKAQAISTLQSDVTAYNTLEPTYRDLVSKGEDQLILEALPTTPDITALAAALDAQGSQSGVQVQSVSTSTATTLPGNVAGATPMNVSVSATGSYSQLMQFLKTIEQSARPMKVSSVNLSGTANAVSASLSILTYYAPAANPQMTTEVVK
jgi:Tfp pilus assembly protein PilO